jgi:hypothetical protein
VDAVPDPPLLRISDSAGIEPENSETEDRNSDHWTTEAVSSHARTLKPLDQFRLKVVLERIESYETNVIVVSLEIKGTC